MKETKQRLVSELHAVLTTNENGQGFHAEFLNGCSLSVQWGPKNYAQAGETVELGAWDARDAWIPLGKNDNVQPHVPIRDIFDWAEAISQRP